MNRKIIPLFAILLVTCCSGLNTLTPALLNQAEDKWKTSRPGLYRLVVEMKGDRVEKEEFDVTVRSGEVVSIKRDGKALTPTPGQDYSMDGLFRMLHQEMDLSAKPVLLGAPEGYTAYLMARFDDATGRLIQYRRSVGGTSNTIDIRVIRYEAQN